MPLAVTSLREIGKYLGLYPTVVPVIGTGSMYPSLFWEKSEGGPDDSTQMAVSEFRTTPHMYFRFTGIAIGGRRYLRRPLGYGDMVAFQSDSTREILKEEGKATDAGFIKRIIGLPGDRIELRDGYVFRNGERLSEPYIYRPRSTYGDNQITDCRTVSVPPGQYLVLGDNRKVSSDSRGDLGFVAESDITFVLPFAEQSIYHSLWRDPSFDAELEGTPTLNSQDFYNLVNAAREQRRTSSLKASPVLQTSASLRGKQYLAGKTDYDLGQAISAVRYPNPLTGEFLTSGRYTAEELLQNLLYFEGTATQILDPQYQDIGVSAVTQEVSGCPTQVIVGHLGGYVPATYDSSTVSSWDQLVSNLESILPSWERARGQAGVDQVKLEELLAILGKRLTLAREISQAMHNQDWLTSDQQTRIERDTADSERAYVLSEELNRQ